MNGGVCMYVCVHAFMCVYNMLLHGYTCVYVCVHVHVCVHVCTWVCVCVYMFVHGCACVCTFVRASCNIVEPMACSLGCTIMCV